MGPVNFLSEFWNLIIQNPKVAAVCFVAGCVAGFSATYFIVSERIKSRDEEVIRLKDEINQYRVSLGIDAQKPTRYQLLSNKELKAAAMTTADRVNDLGREFASALESRKTVAQPASDIPGPSPQIQAAKRIKRAQDVLDKYKRDYAANTILLYREMKTRGATTNENEEFIEFSLSTPTNGFSLAEIATTLRTMAATLPA